MDKTNLIGYHGTKKENTESICSNNFNINKDEDNKLFLGYGIYFFYVYDDAVDWNVKKFIENFSYLPGYDIIIDKYSIIKSEIQIDESEILDLDSKEALYKFEILIEKFNGKLATKQEYIRAKNRTSAIINMLYKRGNIKKKVISKTFVEQVETKFLKGLKNYSRRMFCVKDKDVIINNIEEKELNKGLFESIIYFCG